MLQFSAKGFYWTSQYLEHIKTGCLIESITVNTPVIDFSVPITEKLRKDAVGYLGLIEKQCRHIGLVIAAETALETCEKLESGKSMDNCQWLLDQINGIQKIVEKELKGKFFFYSPPERSKFFPKADDPLLFGKDVGDSFPSASFDIYEAGVCLALARGSACVFHLMRTLEIALASLGSVFGVSLAHTNWAPAIEQIESKIRDMNKDPTWKALPDCKEKQESYAQAASHFGILKDAWRNYTMHVRGKYTEEEAEHVFENTKGFMKKLVDLGLKEVACP
jgi:hypothetical protein